MKGNQNLNARFLTPLIALFFALLVGACNKSPVLAADPTVFVKEIINVSVVHQDVVRIGHLGFPVNSEDHKAFLCDGMITCELWGDSFWISSVNPGPITKFGAETFVNHDKISEGDLTKKIRSLVPALGPNSQVIVARCGENIVILNRNQFSNDVALVIDNQRDRFALVNFDRIHHENIDKIVSFLGGLRFLGD